MLFHDRFGCIAKTEVVCDVSHVHLAQIEYVPQLLGECLVVANP